MEYTEDIAESIKEYLSVLKLDYDDIIVVTVPDSILVGEVVQIVQSLNKVVNENDGSKNSIMVLPKGITLDTVKFEEFENLYNQFKQEMDQ